MTNSKPNTSDTSPSELPPITGKTHSRANVCCKVQQAALTYQLTSLDDELRRRYDDGDATLHELADYINDRITTVTLDRISGSVTVEPAMARAALEGEESLSATKRDDIRATLAGQFNIDILVDSYVSHETVRKHLNEHIGVSTARGGFETYDELRDILQNYQEQYENGVQSALERAGHKELISGDAYRVFSTRIECQQCSETYRLQQLLDDGGCDCPHNG